MAVLPSQSLEMWIPPVAPGMLASFSTYETEVQASYAQTGTGSGQYDPLFVEGFTCQKIAAFGTAGLPLTDD